MFYSFHLQTLMNVVPVTWNTGTTAIKTRNVLTLMDLLSALVYRSMREMESTAQVF